MSIAYETTSLLVEFVPARPPAARPRHREAEQRPRALTPRELPAGVHAIGEVLPLVLAQMGLRVT
ncbi:MAG: hypothetical protein KF708_19105 [Pirellulales bacterium]|nr:hypothetical protein [Pirellulales bacterium]